MLQRAHEEMLWTCFLVKEQASLGSSFYRSTCLSISSLFCPAPFYGCTLYTPLFLASSAPLPSLFLLQILHVSRPRAAATRLISCGCIV
eukprot:1529949-Pleurochrysis_carterae.AAC.2